MRPKNLRDLIRTQMTIGPASTFEQRLLNELRDFFAHEVMITAGLNLHKYAILTELFDKIFKDIPTKEPKK